MVVYCIWSCVSSSLCLPSPEQDDEIRQAACVRVRVCVYVCVLYRGNIAHCYTSLCSMLPCLTAFPAVLCVLGSGQDTQPSLTLSLLSSPCKLSVFTCHPVKLFYTLSPYCLPSLCQACPHLVLLFCTMSPYQSFLSPCLAFLVTLSSLVSSYHPVSSFSSPCHPVKILPSSCHAFSYFFFFVVVLM